MLEIAHIVTGLQALVQTLVGTPGFATLQRGQTRRLGDLQPVAKLQALQQLGIEDLAGVTDPHLGIALAQLAELLELAELAELLLELPELLELLELHPKLPVSWDDLTAAFAMLAALLGTPALSQTTPAEPAASPEATAGAAPSAGEAPSGTSQRRCSPITWSMRTPPAWREALRGSGATGQAVGVPSARRTCSASGRLIESSASRADAIRFARSLSTPAYSAANNSGSRS